jgi:hypothetical protein
VVAAVLLAAPAALPAQGSHPALRGHTFVPTTLIPDPFVKTQLGTFVGIGQAFDFEIEVVIEDDTLLSEDGKMTWVFAEFDYRQRVTDWLQLHGAFFGGARVGTNAPSALAQGVSVTTSFRVGGLARIVESNSVALSGTLDLTNHGVTLLNILKFVQDVVDSVDVGGSLDSIGLSTRATALMGQGGLRFAYAPSRLVGITAIAQLGFGEHLVPDDEVRLDFDVGATVDFNLASVGTAPLGFALGYRFSSFSDQTLTTEGVSHHALLGVSYTGHEDFSVGLELIGERTPLLTGEVVNAAVLALRTRYYF